MKLIIDLSRKRSRLSETLLPRIDRFLRGNKLTIADIEKIEVIPSEKSLVGTRIAKAIALGLKTEL